MGAPEPARQAARFEPKLFSILWRESYGARELVRDLQAGVIVGIVALPLAIAFAIASGVKPEQGLYTAIVAGFLISLLGGSRVQIGGPTGAFIVIVYGIVQQHGTTGLAVATFLAGLMLIAMGVARLGGVIKFVPYPVTVGFTGGIALIIAVAQVRDFLGLSMAEVPADFVDKLVAYAGASGSWNPYAFGIGLLSLALVLYWPRVTHRVPGPLVAIVVCTAAVQLLDLPVETIGSRFGEVPNRLPTPELALPSWTMVRQMFPSAVTIALLAAIESLLSAVVADGMIGTRHRSNTELVAQGIANLASPIFGGIPATGAIARTATNVKNGGRSPIAGLVHALTLLLIMLFFGRWAEWIPITALAGVLLVVAWNMSEVHLFAKFLRGPRGDLAVLATTFLLTVLIDLTVALEVGIVLAAFLFMGQMASVTQAGYVTRMLEEEGDPNDPNSILRREVPPGVEVFEVYGSFFFGAVSKFKDAIDAIEKPPAVLIVRLREVLTIDASGLRALEDVFESTRRHGTVLILSGVHAQPLIAMERNGLLYRVGEDNTVGNIDAALARAREILGLAPAPPVAKAPEVARERA